MLPRVCSRLSATKKAKVTSTSVAKPTTIKRTRIAQAVFDYKRLADKATFEGLNASELEDNARELHVHERLGLDFDLNIILNRNHKITPHNDAFRNLHIRHLVMHANGTADAAKAIHYESTGAAEVFFVEPTMNNAFSIPVSVKTIPEAQFRKIGRALANHIGDAKYIFVEDAAVGSHRLAEVKARGITNNANVALSLRHLLSATAIGQEASQFDVEISIFSAPDFADGEASGLHAKAFTIVNPDRGIILQAGVLNAAAIQQAILSIASARLLQQDIPSLGLNAHVVANKAGQSGLVFDPNQTLVDGGVNLLVSGANGAVWNTYGTFRAFDGAIHNNTKASRQRGDLVENKKTVIQGPATRQPLQFGQPNAVVFLVKDDAGVLPPVARVAADVGSRYFSNGYNGASNTPFYSPVSLVGQPGQAEKLFNELAETNKTPIFVVNSKNLSSEDITQIVNAALDGSLAKVKGVADPTLKCAVISEVAGVKSSVLDPMKGWKDKAQYATASKKLASSLGL